MATASKIICLASTTKKNDDESWFLAKVGSAPRCIACSWSIGLLIGKHYGRSQSQWRLLGSHCQAQPRTMMTAASKILVLASTTKNNDGDSFFWDRVWSAQTCIACSWFIGLFLASATAHHHDSHDFFILVAKHNPDLLVGKHYGTSQQQWWLLCSYCLAQLGLFWQALWHFTMTVTTSSFLLPSITQNNDGDGF